MWRFMEIVGILILGVNQIDITSGNTWNSLHMTWAPKSEENSLAFSNLPVTCEEAKQQGYVEMGDEKNLFKGCRYIRDNDKSNILLFNTDAKGELVGIHSQFPENEIITKTKWIEWFKEEPMFINEGDETNPIYTLTAYTVDLETIGDTIERDGNVGNGLWFQQRSSDEQFWKMPMTTEEATEDDSWTREKCINGMGRHYLWQKSGDTDCMKIRAFFLLYHDNYLSGFGWNIQSHFDYSKRLEHPPKDASVFFYDVPKCLPDLWEKN